MNMQSLILTKITEEIAKDPTLLLICDSDWANTGALRTIRADTLERVATVTYDFQPKFCAFGPTSARIASYTYDTPRSVFGADWVCDSISELVNTVVIALKGEPDDT